MQLHVWTFDEVFALPDEETEDQRIALLPTKVQAQSVASLIFTSGTTGNPKGVMLSHRNLTSMVSMLSSVFDMSTRDGVLSVLPLHHTFEFSTGFLTPLSRGAQITYLPELTSDALARAIKNGHVTGMVGVPALWELLHRRIKTRLYERSDWIGKTADTLIQANAWVREKTPLNLGPFIFYPIHEGLGGRIRYFISGGSALNEKIQQDFQGSGIHHSGRLWFDRSLAGANGHTARESYAHRQCRQTSAGSSGQDRRTGCKRSGRGHRTWAQRDAGLLRQ